MSFQFNLLLLSILAPLAVAVAILLGLPKRLSLLASYFGFGVPAVIALWCWANFPAGVGADYQFFHRYPTGLSALGISLALGLNGISLPLFVLAGVVGLAAGLYAIRSGAERLKLYLMLLLFMQAGLMGAFASVDVFFLYFFHEMALIPTFLMIGIWGGRDRGYAAMKMTIYLTVGAMLSLLGLIALYVQSGAETFDLTFLRLAISEQPLADVWQGRIFGLLMFGFGVLVSLWPFHTWAPLGYGAAPSSAAMLHAGVLKKFGLYGLIQIALPLLPDGAREWSHLLALLALGNVLVVGLVTIAQRDLKQMIGYGSVMHMGYAFLGIACFSALGAGGVLLLMVAHGFSVALLFMLGTSVHQRTGTFDLSEMGGLVRQTPVLASLFAAAMLASIGLPGFANFWGELAIFVALWAYSPAMTVAAVAGVVLSAIYGLRAVAAIFYGPSTGALEAALKTKPAQDILWSERIPALLLLAGLLFLGIFPRTLTDRVDEAVAGVLSAPRQTAVAGLNTTPSAR